METEIEILLSEEQTTAFDAVTENNGIHRVLYGGQVGGGKSYLISFWLIYMANEYPATRYYMARRVLKDLKDSLLLTYFDVAKKLEISYRYYDKTKIVFPNGSEIYLLECENLPSDPNFDRLGSKEYTAGAIEEGIDVSRRAADVLLTRTRYKHVEYNLERKQLITCNPGDGWIKDDIVIPWRENRLKSNTIFVQATLESNPDNYFAEKYRETLEDLPQYEKARLLHGDWDARPKTGGEFLKEFKRETFIKDVEYDPELALHISFDENVNPYLTCLVFQIKNISIRGQIVKEFRQIDEICLPDPRNTRKAICREFERRYYDHREGVFVYGDATSQKSDTGKEKGENFFTDIMSYLRSFNPKKRVPEANPSVISSGGFLDLIFERQNEGLFYQSLRYYISPKCKTSINDYLYTVEDSDGKIKKETEVNPLTGVRYEKNGHCLDAFRYFVTRALGEEYRKYQRGGRNPSYDTGSVNSFRVK
jgi:hypothetical protein